MGLLLFCFFQEEVCHYNWRRDPQLVRIGSYAVDNEACATPNSLVCLLAEAPSESLFYTESYNWLHYLFRREIICILLGCYNFKGNNALFLIQI